MNQCDNVIISCFRFYDQPISMNVSVCFNERPKSMPSFFDEFNLPASGTSGKPSALKRIR